MEFFGDTQSPSRRLGMGIFDFGLDRKIPGDWEFFKSDDFYRGDWGFLSPEIGDFYPRDFPPIPGIRDFLGMGIIREWGFFFVGWDIPPKSHLFFKGKQQKFNE